MPARGADLERLSPSRLSGELGEDETFDYPPAGAVAARGEPSCIGPAPNGVRAHPEELCGLRDAVDSRGVRPVGWRGFVISGGPLCNAG